MQNRVLIIGGCGYVGTALTDYLTRCDYEVSTVDLEWFGNFSDTNLKVDYNTLTASYLAGFSTIVLLAGHCNPRMCNGDLLGSFNNNVLNFVEILPKISPHTKFIYASTIGVYGISDDELVTEDYLAKPVNYYDLSKNAIDSYVRIFDNLEYFGLRFGAVNGLSRNWRGDIMVNAMTLAALTKGEVHINNPKVKRPILSINDLCRAVNWIIRRGTFEKRGIYNLASFNDTVEGIGGKIAKHFSAKLIENPTQPNVYDCSVSSAKFCETFDFYFVDQLQDVVRSIEDGYDGTQTIVPRDKVLYA